MNKQVKLLATAITAATTLAACAGTYWTRYYTPDPQKGSVALAVTTDQKGNAYVVGNIGPNDTEIPFLIKYDPRGKLLLEKQYPSSDASNENRGESFRGYDDVAVDNAGNIYVSEGRWDAQHESISPQILKLNAKGEVLWKWYDPEIVSDTLFLGIEIGKDGNVYASTLDNYAAISLTPSTGKLRWFKDIGDGETAMGRALQTSDGIYTTHNNEVFTTANDYLVIKSRQAVKILGLDGRESAVISAAELGLTKITNVVESQNDIAVVGEETDESISARLIKRAGTTYTVADKQLKLTNGDAYQMRLAPRPAGGFCYAGPGVWFFGSIQFKNLLTGSVDGDLNLLWSHTADTANSNALVTNVKATSDTCFTQVMTNDDTQPMHIYAENALTGQLVADVKPPISGSDLLVSKDSIFSVGFTWIDGTKAVINKLQVR